jgi:transcriptional regulator with XRE-family HTH domain
VISDPADIALGRALRLIRRKRGFTQKALAERLGTRAEHISAMERAVRGVKWRTLLAWLDACDSSLAELAKLI